MRRLSAGAGAALVLALAGCGAGGGRGGPELRVDRDPFRVELVSGGGTVVAQDEGARLRYQLRATGEQFRLTKVLSSHGSVYRVATSEPGRTATVTVTRTRAGFRLSLRLHPAAGVEQVYDAFEAGPDDHFLGGGERGEPPDLRGRVLPVKVSATCSYAPVPFFASSAGWGLRLATRNVAALAFPGSAGGGGCRFGDESQCAFPPLEDRVEVCVRGARLDEDLYAGGFARVLAAYRADAGRPAVPPPAELAPIKWRDVYEGPGQVLEDVARLRAARVPFGWILVDNPWETCVGTLEFDRRRFPDPAGLVRRVHELGLRFMLWISPRTQCDAGYPRRQLLGPVENLTLDLRQPAVVAEYRSRLRRLVALGVDGVKADRGDELDLEGRSESLQNEYPLLYARAALAALPRGAAAIFRAAAMGSQSLVPGLWAGDQPGAWVGLERAIHAGQSAAMSGFPTWGSDVGGYSSEGLTGDLFARWAQLGAVSPVFEVGGIGPNATPWTMGPDAMAALRAAAVLHYELFPYLYGLLRRGEPVLRPLGYAYPGDARAWASDLELLVGPDLLAAPVTGPGTTPSVYLPAGRWVDLHTGAVVKGPAAFTRATPLDELPLYARAGAVVPFNLRTADSWWGADELTHPGRAGYLVAGGARLDLRGQPRDVQLWVPAAGRPARVTLGGRDVPWRWNAGPLPGVVVRVHGPAVRGELVLHGA
ncbi:MAG TPA: TIM-barrel domain-containing protein [Gaiellaceae bacterium]|nr:TIM-barrel domain-containing protein [Gaiellaceae bacterium]